MANGLITAGVFQLVANLIALVKTKLKPKRSSDKKVTNGRKS